MPGGGGFPGFPGMPGMSTFFIIQHNCNGIIALARGDCGDSEYDLHKDDKYICFEFQLVVMCMYYLLL